jgi:hypothetical protein
MKETNVQRYMKSLRNDMRQIKYEEEEMNGVKYGRFKVGMFKMERKVGNDYDHDVKRLYQDFITHITNYYITRFWEL